MTLVEAPWTEEQVAALRAWQAYAMVHPFTAERRHPDGTEWLLIPTQNGWVEVEGGPVVQDWAHDFMLSTKLIDEHKKWWTEALGGVHD
jgi:hypothetical protein